MDENKKFIFNRFNGIKSIDEDITASNNFVQPDRLKTILVGPKNPIFERTKNDINIPPKGIKKYPITPIIQKNNIDLFRKNGEPDDLKPPGF
jgi:hypothetical protein